MTKRQLIDFLNEYDEEDYEIRIIDDYGASARIQSLEWSNGPWIVLEDLVSTHEEIAKMMGADL